MTITRKKALYLFLSSLLGMLLVLMFHRSVFVIYEILGDLFPQYTVFQLNYWFVVIADFITMLLAIFIGGWYGIWLGLHWYKYVYEDRKARTWFHGLIPHQWRVWPEESLDNMSEKAKLPTAPKKIVAQSSRSQLFTTVRTSNSKPVWSFEQVANTPKIGGDIKVVTAKKRVAKKRVRKVVKKDTTIESE